MKKSWIVTLIVGALAVVAAVCVFLVVGRGEGKFYLDDKYYGAGELVEIDGNEVRKLESEEASFVVAVCQVMCAASDSFDVVLGEFTDGNDIKLYKVFYSEIAGTDMENYVKYHPSAVIYRAGKVVAWLDANSNDDIPYYESVDGFKSWLEKYVVLERP